MVKEWLVAGGSWFTHQGDKKQYDDDDDNKNYNNNNDNNNNNNNNASGDDIASAPLWQSSLFTILLISKEASSQGHIYHLRYQKLKK